MQVDIHSHLQGMKCGEKDDMQHHLTTMMTMQEELSGMGSPVDDRDFAAMIVNSLPESYRTLLRTTTAALRASGKSVTPSTIVTVVFEEADHRTIGKDDSATTTDAALNTSMKGGQRNRRLKNSNMTCFSCNRVGHLSKDCWRKGGGKEGQGPHQKSLHSANTATPSGNDFAFTTTTLSREASLLSVPAEKRSAIVDSGASSHFCPDRSKFTSFTHPSKANQYR